MHKKKFFEETELTVIYLGQSDVIMTSSDADGGGTGNQCTGDDDCPEEEGE